MTGASQAPSPGPRKHKGASEHGPSAAANEARRRIQMPTTTAPMARPVSALRTFSPRRAAGASPGVAAEAASPAGAPARAISHRRRRHAASSSLRPPPGGADIFFPGSASARLRKGDYFTTRLCLSGARPKRAPPSLVRARAQPLVGAFAG